MATTSPATGFSLQLRRTLNAPREKVFEAWTDPEKLTRWFCHATPEHSGRVTALDLRPGGHYSAEVHMGGKVWRLAAQYKEIKRPEKLVFTWSWENEPSWGETLVTLEFLERGGQTELILTHEQFSTVEVRNDHNQGWAACLDSLEKLLAA